MPDDKQNSEVRIEGHPSPEAIKAPSLYANMLRVVTDPLGMTTLYFFAMPADFLEVPEIREQLERAGDDNVAGVHVVRAELPATAKIVVPRALLPSLLDTLRNHIAGTTEVHHG